MTEKNPSPQQSEPLNLTLSFMFSVPLILELFVFLVFVLVASLVLSAFSAGLAVTQAEIDELKRQQEEIEAQKDALGVQIGDLQDEMDTMLQHKAMLDEQNELARQEIELINEQIALYESLIEAKALELEEARALEAEQKEALRVRMRNMEEAGSLSYIAILFKASSFTDLLSRLDTINSIMSKDKELEDAYIAAREHVEVVKAEYEAVLLEHEGTKVELEAKKAELEAQIEAASQMIKQLEEDIERYKKEYEENERAEAALDAQIKDALAEMERQRKEAEQSGTPGNFVNGSGTYIWPTPGYSAGNRRFGWDIHPIFGDNRFHAGVDIGAPSGTPVLSIDAGTVAVAATNSSYGNYVVVSHGNGISSLYAHLSSMAVSAGTNVTQGQTVGYVGSTGWSTGPHLHFEIRVNGSAVDPMAYY